MAGLCATRTSHFPLLVALLILNLCTLSATQETCPCAREERTCNILLPSTDMAGFCSFEQVPCVACYCDEALAGDENARTCEVAPRNKFTFMDARPSINDLTVTDLAPCIEAETFITLCPLANQLPAPSPDISTPSEGPNESDSPMFETNEPIDPTGGFEETSDPTLSPTVSPDMPPSIPSQPAVVKDSPSPSTVPTQPIPSQAPVPTGGLGGTSRPIPSQAPEPTGELGETSQPTPSKAPQPTEGLGETSRPMPPIPSQPAVIEPQPTTPPLPTRGVIGGPIPSEAPQPTEGLGETSRPMPPIPSQPAVIEPQPTTPPLPTRGVIGGPPPLPTVIDACDPLANGGEYNVVILGSGGEGNFDFDFANSDAWGSVVVCGNARLQSAGINSKGQSCNGNGLIVSGALSWEGDGQVFAGTTSYDFDDPQSTVSGSAALSCGAEDFEDQVDCNGLSASLNAVNDEFCGKEPTATAVRTGTSLSIECNNLSETEPAITTLTTDLLNGVNFFETIGCVFGIVINVEPGSPSGSQAIFENAGMDIDPTRTIWNICQGVEDVILSGISLQGSIIAPDAKLTGENGNLEGQTMVFEGVTGSAEFHLFGYELC